MNDDEYINLIKEAKENFYKQNEVFDKQMKEQQERFSSLKQESNKANNNLNELLNKI